MNTKRFLSLFLTLLPLLALAQTQAEAMEPLPGRAPVARSVMVGIGRTSQLDTYLSPMTYDGMAVGFMTQRERMTRMADRHISFQSTLQGTFTKSDNPARTADYLGGRLAYDAGWHYHYSPLKGLDVKGGALVGTDLGFLYNSRNGNNPAQGRFSIDLSLSAGAAYDFKIRKLPLRLAYQADLPMLGMMFCPEFGESYYEISQRGVGHDLVCAHPGNAFSLRQLLVADVCLKRLTLRVGYLCDIRQSNARNLKYHDYSHSFMLGFVRYFQLMGRKNEVR